MEFNTSFVLLNISFVMLLVTLIYVLNIKNKKQIHYVFLSFIGSTLIWTFGYLGLLYWYHIFNYDSDFFVKIVLTGIILTPLSVFFLGYLFAYTRINFTLKYKLIFVLPIISLIIAYTNKYHGLFYTFFSAENTTFRVYGPWITVHIIYSYMLIFIGLWYLVFFTIKNSGFFSNQSRLVILGLVFPLIINILITFQIGNLPYYFEAIAFSFAVICFALAIFRFKFLNVVPIAMQRIVDLISDSFVVVDEELRVIDYNRTFIDTFGHIFTIKRKESIIKILCSNPEVDINEHDFLDGINEAREKRRSVCFEKHLKMANIDKYFTVEITSIIFDNNYFGAIILLKDITQNKKDLETIKEKQAILMEQERLASLGQLIGGIAHNLRTPIMSIAGAIEGMKDLVNEYDESIDDKNVTNEDHHEIAKDMNTWLDKMKPHCAYMSDVITTVKGQAVQFNSLANISFTVNELVKRIEILMKHELIKFNCVMNVDFQVDLNSKIKGEVNNLVQIFDNIIINAIHSYEGENGTIDFRVVRSGDNIEFSISDYGKGIPEEIKDRLFKEMVTTKGKNGTGLGLYMSYSTIKGRFGGNIWFTSKEGKGTTFYVSIPCHNSMYDEEVVS